MLQSDGSHACICRRSCLLNGPAYLCFPNNCFLHHLSCIQLVRARPKLGGGEAHRTGACHRRLFRHILSQYRYQFLEIPLSASLDTIQCRQRIMRGRFAIIFMRLSPMGGLRHVLQRDDLRHDRGPSAASERSEFSIDL